MTKDNGPRRDPGGREPDLHKRVEELEVQTRHLDDMLNRVLKELCSLRQLNRGNWQMSLSNNQHFINQERRLQAFKQVLDQH